jgi:hypothetical protein
MFNLRFSWHFLALISIMLILSGKSTAQSSLSNSSASSSTAQPLLDVYKSPTCGCCEIWVTHMQANGYQTNIHHPEDLNKIKNKYQINPKFQSCHTAVSAEGYIFEGHIPAWVITQFLTEKPKDARGLAVPGMPIGSPGMEIDERITPYGVLLINTDGSSKVYTRITELQKNH